MKVRRAFRFYFVNILLGILIFSIAAVIGIAMFCSIHKVTVKGSKVYAKADIEKMVLDGKYPNNSVYEVIHNKIKPKKNIPFVDSVTVKLTSYDKVKIVVCEKPCVGYIPIKKGGYAYFDENGNVIEISDKVINQAIGIQGVILEEAKMNQKIKLEKEQLELMVQLLKSLDKYELEISSLTFDEQKNAAVLYQGITIAFGKKDYFEDKMMRLTKILPQLEGQTGTLHLENWSKDNTDIVFRKAE